MARKLSEQVIVVTGASSGIGRETALQAALEGSKVVMAGRNQEAMEHLRDEIRGKGGDAVVVKADVASETEVQGIARVAIEQYGRIDTWVNNAGVSIYGPLLDVPIADQRRLFDTNYWGAVNGSLEAVRHMREQGGTIINVGSTLSDVAMPLQGAYSASKHALKGFSDALRNELRYSDIPVEVCLIKPGAIDTPYPQHARNFMQVKPQNPPPQYSPTVVARTILHCAEHPRRDVFVGAGGKVMSFLGNLMPQLSDALMSRFMITGQMSDEPATTDGQDGLYSPSEEIGSRGERPIGPVLNSSLYTQATLHPLAAGAIAALSAYAISQLFKSGERPRRLSVSRAPEFRSIWDQ